MARLVVGSLFALLLSLTPARAAGGRPQPARSPRLTVDQIVKRGVDAIGGTAWRSRSHGIVTKMSATGPGAETWPTSVTYARAPDLFVQVLFEPEGMPRARGFDGENAWETNAEGFVTTLTGVRAAELRRDGAAERVTQWRKWYRKAEVVGTRSVAGKPTYAVRFTPVEGEPETLFFDAKSFLLVRRAQSVRWEGNTYTYTTDYFDYRKKGPTLVPCRIVQSMDGRPWTEIAVTSVSLDTPLPDSLFRSFSGLLGSWWTLEHRDFAGSYAIRAGGLQVAVAPAVGGRITWFGTPDDNLLFEDPQTDGKLLPEGADWMPWDGCQTDLIDDRDGRQHGPVWQGRYEVVSAEKNALVLRSAVHPKSGIQVTKRYELDARLPGLRYTVTATNRGQAVFGWSIWERALFATPGWAVMPCRTGGPLKGLWRKDVPQGAVEEQAGYVVVRPAGKGSSVATDSPEGWIAYHEGAHSVILRYKTDAGGDYREGKTGILYLADNRVELEPLSPRVELKPGESVTLMESWQLLRHPEPARVTPEDLVEAARRKAP